MEFREFADYLGKLEGTNSRLEMTEIVRELLLDSGNDLRLVVLFVQGRLFPSWDPSELGIASKLMIKCVSIATGFSEVKVQERIVEKGDTGLACEELFENKTQTTLYTSTLDLAQIEELARKISTMEGHGSQDRKTKYIVEILNSAEGGDVKYLAKLLLGEMRLGVGEGVVRDAIAKAWDLDPVLVERAFSLRNDYGEIAVIARDKGTRGLEAVDLKLGRPLRPMLAQTVKDVSEAFDAFKPAAFEVKYDGMRTQIHVFDGNVRVFTRRLEDVTKQFPDIVEEVRERVKTDNCVIEGESVAVNDKEEPRPFQVLSKRIKRKYKIKETIKEIPVVLYLFDCMYLEGKTLVKTPLRERRELLESIVKESDRLKLSKLLVTDREEPANEFYQKALDKGHEGVMIKNLSAEYKPGSRVGYMYKLKPVAETLDLVVVGAEQGKGRRTKWFGSYLLACREEDTGKFLEIGKMATGLSDEQLETLTEKLEDDVLGKKGEKVRLNPRLVLEVGYQDLQKSQTYSSGYALRFPRLIRIREDKSPQEAESLGRVIELAGS